MEEHTILQKLEEISKEVGKISHISEQVGQISQKLEEHDQRFESIDGRLSGIDSKLKEHDKRFEEIDKRFNKIDERLDDHDEKFDLIIKKIIEHDERLEQTVTKTEFYTFVEKQMAVNDHLVTMIKRLDEDRYAMIEWMRRIEEKMDTKFENYDTMFQKIKQELKLSF